MPIVVNPGFVWPPESDPVVSPDGRITAIVDPSHAGVLLRADYSDQAIRPEDVVESINRLEATVGNGATDTSGWTPSGGETLEFVTDEGLPAIEAIDPVGGGSIYADPTYRPTPELGQWVGFTVEIKAIDQSRADNMRIRIQGYSGTEVDVGVHSEPVTTDSYTKLTMVSQVTSYDPAGYVRTLIWPTETGTDPGGFRFRRAVVTVADTEDEALEAVSAFFDGDTPDGETVYESHYRYAEDGTSEKYLPALSIDESVARVRFERQDGTLVRSGNPAWAPGGWAHAYDHEATLGGGTLWRAVPIMFDGTEGTPSDYVGAVIPALSDGWAWLKPVNDPDKAMLLKVEPPDLSYDGRVDTTSITGSSKPAATWDVLEGFTTQLRSLVREKPVADQLMALLDEGPVLAQFPDCAGLPDFFFIRGGVDLEHVHWDGYPWRRYQWDVISIDRPDTTDSPLRIPGLSYNTVERDWTTYDQLAATVPSYDKLLEP